MEIQFTLDVLSWNRLQKTLTFYWHSFVQTLLFYFLFVALGSSDLTKVLLSWNLYFSQNFNQKNFCQNTRGLRQILGWKTLVLI